MSKKRTKGLAQIIAETALDYRDDGNYWPAVPQLLAPLNGNVPSSWEDIRDLLQQSRYLLENHYGVCVCPASEVFYKGMPAKKNGVPARSPFTKKPPRNETEAAFCIPGGKGGKVAGLYFPVNPKHDLIYLEFGAQGGHQGASHMALSIQRCHQGVNAGVLDHRKTRRRMETVSGTAFLKKMSPLLEKLALGLGSVFQRLDRIENKIDQKRT